MKYKRSNYFLIIKVIHAQGKKKIQLLDEFKVKIKKFRLQVHILGNSLEFLMFSYVQCKYIYIHLFGTLSEVFNNEIDKGLKFLKKSTHLIMEEY